MFQKQLHDLYFQVTVTQFLISKLVYSTNLSSIPLPQIFILQHQEKMHRIFFEITVPFSFFSEAIHMKAPPWDTRIEGMQKVKSTNAI